MRLACKTLAALCAARVAPQPKLEWEASNQALMFPILFVELIKTSTGKQMDKGGLRSKTTRSCLGFGNKGGLPATVVTIIVAGSQSRQNRDCVRSNKLFAPGEPSGTDGSHQPSAVYGKSCSV
jgi:hypothetical protein